ncbi:seleno K [Pelobates cultripes]|uniref:Selenoprotein K n=1 Tax=Pelobates cultripes TaxID=61616 RepID=A0AAD1T208_PELCU|nr:seleno K [Pelobates cultripes]
MGRVHLTLPDPDIRCADTDSAPGAGRMVYISNGQVLDGNRSPWRLSFITDLFWGIADFFVLFFKSILQPDISRKGYSNSISSSRYDDGRGPPPPPRRRMGRINHGTGPNAPPMGGGG